MADQRTLTFVKPDGVQRRLVGEIVSRLERRGLKILGLKMMRVSKELAERHYGEHKGKKFYDGLVQFVTSGPIVALCIEGNEANGVHENFHDMGYRNPVFLWLPNCT